ncbi:MAG TPA: hypothetical protein VGG10_15240 [Rhizomicrobium sp.]|jgi:hypothetical protein
MTIKRFAALSFDEAGQLLQACTFFASDACGNSECITETARRHLPDETRRYAVIGDLEDIDPNLVGKVRS